MLNFKNLLSRALLAFTLAAGAGAAVAGPTYHVDVDTSTLAGSQGYLDFLLLGQGDAAAASARLSHLSGDFSGDEVLSGAVSGSAKAGATIANSDFTNELSLWSTFGGHFSFDVSFDLAATPLIGSLFEVALLDADFLYLAPTSGDIAQFSLMPGQPVGLVPGSFATISIVSDVPEPADWMLMAAGLALLRFTVRRRA
jgi:hypothetical protein